MSGLHSFMEGNNNSWPDFGKSAFAQSHSELSSRQTSAPSTPTDSSTTPIQRGEQEHEKQDGQGQDGNGNGESPLDTPNNGDGNADGAPLDRTQSQANKLGTKQIAVIMMALCVRICLGSEK